MNPIFWLELRLRAREKRLWILALFYLVALFVFFGFGLLAVYKSERNVSEPAVIGNVISWVVVYSQAILLVILAPLATAGRISQEREQRTMPALVNSPISAWSVCLGKLLGSWSFIIWLSCLALPFLAVSTLWGGPSWEVLCLTYALNLAAGLCLSAISLGISGWFGRSLTSYLATGAFLFGWFVVVPILGMIMGIAGDKAKNSEWIMYLFYYHNPLAPLIALSHPMVSQNFALVLRICICAVSVWTALTVGSILMAVKSLKKEIY